MWPSVTLKSKVCTAVMLVLLMDGNVIVKIWGGPWCTDVNTKLHKNPSVYSKFIVGNRHYEHSFGLNVHINPLGRNGVLTTDQKLQLPARGMKSERVVVYTSSLRSLWNSSFVPGRLCSYRVILCLHTNRGFLSSWYWLTCVKNYLLLRNPKFHYCFHYILPLDSTLSQQNPSLPFYIIFRAAYMRCYILISPFCFLPSIRSGLFPSRSFFTNAVYIYYFSRHASCPSSYCLLDLIT